MRRKLLVPDEALTRSVDTAIAAGSGEALLQTTRYHRARVSCRCCGARADIRDGWQDLIGGIQIAQRRAAMAARRRRPVHGMGDGRAMRSPDLRIRS